MISWLSVLPSRSRPVIARGARWLRVARSRGARVVDGVPVVVDVDEFALDTVSETNDECDYAHIPVLLVLAIPELASS